MDNWIDYLTTSPTEAGVYEWRMPSRVVEDVFVIVAAHMRLRGAGYTDVLSPVFDGWDGYNVLVPRGLQWHCTTDHQDLKNYDTKLIGIEGLEHAPCIYCGTTPKLRGYQIPSGGGVVVNASPQNLNSFHLECCAWGKTPSFRDPRELERIRREAFARAAEVAT